MNESYEFLMFFSREISSCCTQLLICRFRSSGGIGDVGSEYLNKAGQVMANNVVDGSMRIEKLDEGITRRLNDVQE